MLDNLPLLISIVPVLLVLARVASVSSLDPGTLALLIQTIDVFQLALGTLIQVGPMILLMAVGVGIVQEPQRARQIWSGLPPHIRYLLVLVLTLAMLAAPPLTLLLAVALPVLVLLANKLGGGRLLAQFITYSLLVVALLVVASPTALWLPVERFDIGKPQPLVGYVLREAENDGRMTILLDRGRTVVVIGGDEVKRREPCRLRKPAWPLAAYVNKSTPVELPLCP